MVEKIIIEGEGMLNTERTIYPENSFTGETEDHDDRDTVLKLKTVATLLVTCPPKAPSFITRVCGFGFYIRRLRFGQARRARSPQIAQALDALQRVFGFPMMSGV